MLHQLDAALERMLRHRLRRDQLDIAFDTPDAEWGAGLGTKPTLNLFLWDIRRSADESRSGRQRVIEDGVEVWRPLLPRIEFQYLLTAWTAEVADEHRLLGESLVAILGCQVLADDYLPAFAAATDPPPSLRVVRADGKDLAEFWGAIDGKLKPGLNLVVSASIDPHMGSPAGPPVERYDLTIKHVDADEDAPPDTRHRIGGQSDEIGGLVRSPRGTALVRSDGNFLVDAEPSDTVVIEFGVPQDRDGGWG